jgi:flagellar hook-length control protein FliK
VNTGEGSGQGRKGLRAGKKEAPFAKLFAGLLRNLKQVPHKNKTAEKGVSFAELTGIAAGAAGAGQMAAAGKQAPAKAAFQKGLKVSAAENRDSGADPAVPGEEKTAGIPEKSRNFPAPDAGTEVSVQAAAADEGRSSAPAFAGPEPAVKEAETGDEPDREGRKLFSARGAAAPAGQKDASGEKAAIAEPKSKKNRDKLNLELRDFRSAAADNVQNQELKVTEETDAGGETHLVVELRSGGDNRETADMFREIRPARSFENILARELHQNLNGDIVRHASIVLRDGNEGTIRLSLKPESLGNVKIHLEMTENKIAGRIVVESGEALRAFEREIRSLEQAFRDSGFAGAALEMAVASGGGRNGADRQWRGEETSPFYSARLAASAYDAPAGDAEPVEFSSGAIQSRIDMLA